MRRQDYNPVLDTDLDDALYQAMLDAVGQTLAMRAVDATARVLVGMGLTRDYSPPTRREEPA